MSKAQHVVKILLDNEDPALFMKHYNKQHPWSAVFNGDENRNGVFYDFHRNGQYQGTLGLMRSTPTQWWIDFLTWLDHPERIPYSRVPKGEDRFERWLMMADKEGLFPYYRKMHPK